LWKKCKGLVVKASKDALDNANVVVTQKDTTMDKKNVVGEAKAKTFLKGKRRSKQEVQGKVGEEKG